MGTIHQPSLVQFFCALLVAPSVPLTDVEAVLVQHYGAVCLRSTPFPFTQTTYYTREMGAPLTRLYLAFEPLIDMAALVALKRASNTLETTWCNAAGQRRVNIDPGYLDLAKVVLASTKDHSHRLYIGDGIFAEVTLRYRQHAFHPWEWTYPDYHLPETLHFFNALRTWYKTQLRQPAALPPQPPPGEEI